MSVIFRVDGSHALGLGHVARSVSLARALRDRGMVAGFITRPLDGNGAARIREAGFEARLLPDDDAVALGKVAPDDADATFALLGDERPAWLVVDHYGIGEAWEAALRPAVDHILVIDDLADRRHDCDAILDANILRPTERNYDGLVPAACRQLLGPSYALMKPEFADLHDSLPAREAPVERVVVNFGGSDIAGLTVRTLEALRKIDARSLDVDVVVGLGQESDPRLQEAAASMRRVRLVAPQPSLAPLFAGADLAVGAGGVSMWERCCLGLPSLVITSADNQIEGTRAADEMGLVSWVGHFDAVTDDMLAEALRAALDWDDLGVRSRRASVAVDGLGAARIAAMMANGAPAALRLRPATVRDEGRYLAWVNDPVTRAQSLDTRPIDPQDHGRWFHQRLGDPSKCRLLVAELSCGLEIGQVRFDLSEQAWTIDYSIDPAFRGRRLGRSMIEAAIESVRASDPDVCFLAQVKASNPASQQVLRSLGFTTRAERDDVAIMELVP